MVLSAFKWTKLDLVRPLIQIFQVAIELVAKPLMPKWLYILGGKSRWKCEASANWMRDKLWARPNEG